MLNLKKGFENSLDIPTGNICVIVKKNVTFSSI